MLGASFFFDVMGLLVKCVSVHLGAWEIVLFRSLVPAVLLLPPLLKAPPALLRQHAPLLLLRGVIGGAAMTFYFQSIAMIPYADASLLCNMSPVFAGLFAAIFLGERLSPRIRYALPAALVGLVFVIKPDMLFKQGLSIQYGYLFGFLSGVCSGAAYTAVRRLTQACGVDIVVGVFAWVTTVMSLPFAVAAWRVPSGTDMVYLIGVGLTAMVAQMLMTLGYRDLPAAQASTISVSTVVMAALLGVVFLHETMDGGQVLGMALVGAAVCSLTAYNPQPVCSNTCA